jgi:hypothetical protein
MIRKEQRPSGKRARNSSTRASPHRHDPEIVKHWGPSDHRISFRILGNPYLGITSGLPVTRAQSPKVIDDPVPTTPLLGTARLSCHVAADSSTPNLTPGRPQRTLPHTCTSVCIFRELGIRV